MSKKQNYHIYNNLDLFGYFESTKRIAMGRKCLQGVKVINHKCQNG